MNRQICLSSSRVQCRFCQLLSEKSEVSGIDIPWIVNDRYAALVSLGALVPGWSLVCPIEHRLNLSQHYRKAEFWDFASSVVRIVRHRHGEVRLFEHGAYTQDSSTGCGTGHSHLHVVPLDFSLSIEALRFDSKKQWQPCIASDIEELSGGREYLFVADQFDGMQTKGLVSLLSIGTSQFFRRVIAHRLGLAEFFDYRRYPMLEIAETSAAQLRADSLKQRVSTRDI